MKWFKAIVVSILAFEARLLLRRNRPRVVMVTGSVGKTGTKDAIAEAIKASSGMDVRSSKKSLNSEIGVPLTVLDLPTGWNNLFSWVSILCKGFFIALFGKMPRFLVIEAGVDRPNDMDKTLAIVKPEVAVVTMFPDNPVHALNFKHLGDTAEAVAREKGKIFKYAEKIVVGADHQRAIDMAKNFNKPIITFGMSPNADFHIEGYEINYDSDDIPSGFYAEVVSKNIRESFNIEGSIGETQAIPISAVAAVLEVLDLPVKSGVYSASKISRQSGRTRILKSINKSVIIDDSYNASPVAVSAAIRSASAIKRKGRFIALLGDMRELGDASKDAHSEIGKMVGASGADLLVVVGNEAKEIANSALELGCKAEIFSDSESAGEFLKGWIGEGDIVLVKGSQGIRMERATKKLLENPEDSKYLPRQEEAWKNR